MQNETNNEVILELNPQDLSNLSNLKDNLDTAIQDLFDWFEDKGYSYDIALKHIMGTVNNAVYQ
jgi:hypothetical protein